MNQGFFASPRERRLWVWALVIVVTIYSSLGLTSLLMEVVPNRELFVNAFIWGFGIIWLVVIINGLRVRPRGFELAVWLGVVAVYLFAFARMGIPERTHLFEYTVVATIVYEALKERVGHGRVVYAPAVSAVVLASAIGIVDEALQLLIPSRVFDMVDIGFNTLAATLAVLANVSLGWVRTRVERLRAERWSAFDG